MISSLNAGMRTHRIYEIELAIHDRSNLVFLDQRPHFFRQLLPYLGLELDTRGLRVEPVWVNRFTISFAEFTSGFGSTEKGDLHDSGILCGDIIVSLDIAATDHV